MFTNKASIDSYKEVLDGISMRTLVHGDSTLMTEVVLKKGSRLPLHSHPHEQTGYLVSGRIDLTIDGVTHEVSPGDSWNIPGGKKHSATALEDTVVVEISSPAREEYLP